MHLNANAYEKSALRKSWNEAFKNQICLSLVLKYEGLDKGVYLILAERNDF